MLNDLGAMRYLYLDLKPRNLHDWGSQSAIDPINPLVYIQASYHVAPSSTQIVGIPALRDEIR